MWKIAIYQKSSIVSLCFLHTRSTGVIPIVNWQIDKVDTVKDGYVGKYGMDTTEKVIPKTILIHYVTVNEKYSVCLFHYRIPDSKYEVYESEHIVK